MQQYARPRYIAKQAKICKLYAQICMHMQYMQSRIPYAEYARICTPHFADGAGLYHATGRISALRLAILCGPGKKDHDAAHWQHLLEYCAGSLGLGLGRGQGTGDSEGSLVIQQTSFIRAHFEASICVIGG